MVDPPEDPGILTMKTAALKMPISYKEGGFEPLHMFFSRFCKQVETIDTANPNGPQVLLEVCEYVTQRPRYYFIDEVVLIWVILLWVVLIHLHLLHDP